MKKTKTGYTIKSPKPNMFLLPLAGMGLFLILYFFAALTYPGGSWIFPNQEGFSFWHNYLCDLLDTYAINGAPNTARSYAIAALSLLCSGLFLLWYYLSGLFETRNTNQKIMRISGLLSLLIILFLASGNHDKIVRIAGFFGVIAFITCSFELFRAGYKKLFLLGVLCLSVFLINYYIYETGIFITSLPVVQKITFVLFIIWFVSLDIALYRRMVIRKKLSAIETS